MKPGRETIVFDEREIDLGLPDSIAYSHIGGTLLLVDTLIDRLGPAEAAEKQRLVEAGYPAERLSDVWIPRDRIKLTNMKDELRRLQDERSH